MGEGARLLGEDRDGVVERKLAERRERRSQRPDVSRDVGFVSRRPAGDLHGRPVDLREPPLRPVLGETKAGSPERVREDHVAPGLDVLPVHGLDG